MADKQNMEEEDETSERESERIIRSDYAQGDVEYHRRVYNRRPLEQEDESESAPRRITNKKRW